MLKSKKDKRERVKHPCSVCFNAVGEKYGLQCQGACKRWVHFSCMNYSPSKIRDIQTGKIEITCPCPNCDNQTIIRQTCDKVECPANKSKFLDHKRKPIPETIHKNEIQHMSETIHEEQKPRCCKHYPKRSSNHELSPILKRSQPRKTHPIKIKESVSDEPESPRPQLLRPLQIPLPLELQSESPQKYTEPPYFPHKRHQHQRHRTLDTSPTQIPQQQFQQSHMQSPESQTSGSQQEKSLEEQLQMHKHCPPEFEHYPMPNPTDTMDAIFPTQDLRQPQHHWAATKMSHNELYNLQNKSTDLESMSIESAIRLDAEETLPPIILENPQNEPQTGQWSLNPVFLENNSQNEGSQQTLNNSYALKQNEVDLLSDQVMEPQLKHPISMYTSYPDVLTSLSASHLKTLAPQYRIQQDNNQSQVGQTPYQQNVNQQMADINQNLLRNGYLPLQYPLPILVPHTMNQQQQIMDHIQQQQISQPNQQQPIPQPQQKKQQTSQPQQNNQKKQQESQPKQQQQKKQQISKSQQQQQQILQPPPQIPQSHQQYLQQLQQLQQQLQQQQPYRQIQIPCQIPQYQQQNPQLHLLPPQQQILIRQPIYQQPLHDPRLPQYVQIPQYAQPYPQYQIPQTPPPQYQRIPRTQQKTYPPLPYLQLIPQNQQMQTQMYQKQYRNTCELNQMLNQGIDNRKSQEINTKTPSFVASPAINVTGISEEVLVQRIPLSLGTSNTATAAATTVSPASPTPNISAGPMSPITPLTPMTPTSPICSVTPRSPQTPRSPSTLVSRRDDVSMKTISNRTNYSRQETLTSLSMSCLSISENILKPAHPSKSDSQVSFPSERRRVLISAMEQMYETMGQFHTQFRDLMCRMMTIFEDRP